MIKDDYLIVIIEQNVQVDVRYFRNKYRGVEKIIITKIIYMDKYKLLV